MNPLRQSLQDGLALAARGATSEAIALLDAAFTKAMEAGDVMWISLIGRNLAIICEHEGQLPIAIKYIRRVLELVPLDRQTIYHLGGLLGQIGDDLGSNNAFKEALKLARQESDHELLELLLVRGFQ
jgi:Flp pilus assembly protein TadD